MALKCPKTSQGVEFDLWIFCVYFILFFTVQFHSNMIIARMIKSTVYDKSVYNHFDRHLGPVRFHSIAV